MGGRLEVDKGVSEELGCGGWALVLRRVLDLAVGAVLPRGKD